MHFSSETRPLRVLVASADPTGVALADKVIQRLSRQPSISLKAILEPGALGAGAAIANDAVSMNVNLDHHGVRDAAHARQTAAELCEWADILCLAPVDAGNLAKLLHGMTDTLLLEVVRSWDVSKKILLVPAMSTLMWENPMSKKQLTKLRRKWNWVRVLQPVLWTFDKGTMRILSWDVLEDIVETLRNQVDLLAIEQDISPARSFTYLPHSKPAKATLPSEIWSLILNHTGDWELAQALHIYTNLPRPHEWHRPAALDPSQMLMKDLEWAILTGTLADVKSLFASNPTPKWLSHLCVKLTVKFSKTSLLSYLENNHHALFWEAFGHKRIPTLASATFGRIDVLEWWRTSPSFLTKEYTNECLDGASRAGFTHVLDWWRNSGLPLRYSEAALEQASSKGDLEVLEWWRQASEHGDAAQQQQQQQQQQQRVGTDSDDDDATANTEPYLQNLALSSAKDDDARATILLNLPLKVGKSLMFAAQHNQVAALRWWDASGIPYAHEDQVAKIASASGYVSVLQLWKEAKGEKMIFDNQVLVAATKHGHADVLDWWKYSGFRVEYKTCDVEEALEDTCVSGRTEEKVRKWWARNGLNLGISTSEWTKTKLLG